MPPGHMRAEFPLALGFRTPWPKLFHNLRTSRETEMAATYPLHVVCEWIGNSQRIAAKHYLQVTDDYFRAALKEGGAKSGAQAAQESGAANRRKKSHRAAGGGE